MRWRGRQQSRNIDDRRGQGGGGGRGGLGGIFGARGSRRRKGGGMSLTVIIIAGIAMLFGFDPRIVLQLAGGLGGGGGDVVSVGQPASNAQISPQEQQTRDFISVVLKDTEDTWNEIFPSQIGQRYREPTLVLFRGQVRSACGAASSASGPFYCPADQQVYIDLGFFEELKNRFGAPGDFAQAYVVAHEVAHHVQTLLGISGKVNQARANSSKVEANRLLVRLELQADCLSGVWARHAHEAKNILESGDIEEAMNAAAQIGDDTLQRRSTGRVVPDSFTHGTSEQRQRWFYKGLETGDINNCDTFNARTL